MAVWAAEYAVLHHRLSTKLSSKTADITRQNAILEVECARR